MKISRDTFIVKHYHAITFVLLVFSIIALYYIPQKTLFGGGKSLCIFKRITGFNCPGCGLTRGFYLLLHLRFSDSLHYNPAAVFVAPILITEIILSIIPESWIWRKASAVCYYTFLTAVSANYAFFIYKTIYPSPLTLKSHVIFY